VILKTDFRDDGAGDLVQYIQRDRSQDAVNTIDVRNPAGRTLSDAELERFIDKSQQHNFQRHMIVSPDPTGQYTPAEVNANTQQLMNREIAQHPTTEYVYTVHRDTEFPHAHVSVTGREQELEMDRAEIDRLRERASDFFNEPERAQEATSTSDEEATRTPSETVPEETREELHERELAMEAHPEKEVLRATERAEERAPSEPPSEAEREERRDETPQADPEPEPEREAEPEPEPELEREQDWMMGG
jgi:hypothetical protein